MNTTITNIATAKGTAPAPDIATDKTNASVPMALHSHMIVYLLLLPLSPSLLQPLPLPLQLLLCLTLSLVSQLSQGLPMSFAINTVTVTNTVIMTTVINSVVGTVDWTAEAAVRTTLQTSTVQFLSMPCTLSLPSSLTSVTP